jgi:hypothetical protein
MAAGSAARESVAEESVAAKPEAAGMNAVRTAIIGERKFDRFIFGIMAGSSEMCE